MLEKEFPHLLPHLAVGLFGAGSECLGLDDDMSRDHDFEAGFILLLPDESAVDRQEAFRLERAYAALPKEFMGVKRSRIAPTGGARHGVLRRADFLIGKTGTPDGELSLRDFLYLPEQALLEVTNGTLFHDGDGKFTAIRKSLSYLPEDVRRKKMAGELLLMGQAGEYNLPRALSRGDAGAAQLSLLEFVKSALHFSFLFNRKYLPYYKWQFKLLDTLPTLSQLSSLLLSLISAPASENAVIAVDMIAKTFKAALADEGTVLGEGASLEAYAYAVNDTVTDRTLRSLHVLAGV
jgi:hypothetical protein